MFSILIKCFHGIRMPLVAGRRACVASALGNPGLFASIFHRTKRKTVFGLVFLYKQERKKGSDTGCRLHIRNRPREKVLPSLGRWFCDIKRSSEVFLEQFRNHVSDLTKCHPFGVGRLFGIFRHSDRVSALFYSYRSVGIYCSGEIGNLIPVHSLYPSSLGICYNGKRR